MSRSASDLLDDEIVEHLVGVIDLKAGQAVHAVAGRRDQYAAVGCTSGDAIALIDKYRSLGLRQLYVADLDAIETTAAQCELIEQLLLEARDFRSFILDAGWRGDEPNLTGNDWTTAFGNLNWVAATESAIGTDSLDRLSRLVPPRRIVLSLDYRDRQLLGGVDLERWLQCAHRLAIDQILVLDLQAVGTSAGNTAAIDLCGEVLSALPDARLLSGGGIRDADDVRRFRQAGADRCLIATALHDR